MAYDGKFYGNFTLQFYNSSELYNSNSAIAVWKDININQVNLVFSVVQAFYIFIDFLSTCSVN